MSRLSVLVSFGGSQSFCVGLRGRTRRAKIERPLSDPGGMTVKGRHPGLLVVGDDTLFVSRVSVSMGNVEY